MSHRGRIIGNKYHLLRQIGAGGMGEVYLAELRGSHGFARRVAIKMLPPHLGDDAYFRELFIREGRVLSRLYHPCLVNIFDFSADEDGLYLCMEYIDGASLRDLVTYAHRSGLKLPKEMAVKIGEKIAQGLAYVHSQGVIHGDLSPKNIMLGKKGEVKLLDFGLSRVMEEVTGPPGKVGGKKSYMAPEILSSGRVFPASDVFSLGVILRELEELSSSEGEGGDGEEESTLSLSVLAARCLMPDPEERPSAEEVARELKELRLLTDTGIDVEEFLESIGIFEGEPETVAPSPGSQRNGSGERRGKFRLRFLLPAFIAITLLIAGAFFFYAIRGKAGIPHSRKVQSGKDEYQPSAKVSGKERVQIAGRPGEKTKEAVEGGGRDKVIGKEGEKSLDRRAPGKLPANRRQKVTKAPAKEAKTSRRVEEKFVTWKIESVPGGASVYIDGVDVGSTPLVLKRPEKDIQPSYEVVLEKSGYRTWQARVSPERMASLEVSLEPMVGFLSVNVYPWAYVRVDGKVIGTTPLIEVPLPAGEHRLELFNDRLGIRREKKITLGDGEKRVVIEDFLSPKQ
ncbi:MAG: PEGA domain-containing protein [Deltaproteobacteria bacterium]|nr:MAG: PEGA domain-containing protein [Deltaproteobacteria bacterium]